MHTIQRRKYVTQFYNLWLILTWIMHIMHSRCMRVSCLFTSWNVSFHRCYKLQIALLWTAMKPHFGSFLPLRYDSSLLQLSSSMGAWVRCHFCNATVRKSCQRWSKSINKLRGIRFCWIRQFRTSSQLELVLGSHPYRPAFCYIPIVMWMWTTGHTAVSTVYWRQTWKHICH